MYISSVYIRFLSIVFPEQADSVWYFFQGQIVFGMLKAILTMNIVVYSFWVYLRFCFKLRLLKHSLRGSNLGPSTIEPDALPTKLLRLYFELSYYWCFVKKFKATINSI